MAERILYTKPSITEVEIALATDAARHGWGERCYEYIGRFEEAFRRHIGVRHAIATSSCTGAMHMGLAALGVGAGDEVVLADTNWIATAAPIVHLGAKPVFVDILADSWCIDPKSAERAISARTKAIVATHLYGNLCDMDALLALSARHGIPIIEDAAEALGSRYREKPAGSLGLFSTFSFHGSKTITTGEGGMFCTDDAALHENVLTLSNHGRARDQQKQFWPDMIGYKYKISNVQAAIGVGQVQRIDELVARKREILGHYKRQLCESNALAMNPEPPHVINGAWMPTVVFARETGVQCNAALAAFKAADIDARVFFHPLSSLDLFASRPDNEVAYDIANRAVNLPSYHDISTAAVDRVCEIVKGLVNG